VRACHRHRDGDRRCSCLLPILRVEGKKGIKRSRAYTARMSDAVLNAHGQVIQVRSRLLPACQVMAATSLLASNPKRARPHRRRCNPTAVRKPIADPRGDPGSSQNPWRNMNLRPDRQFPGICAPGGGLALGVAIRARCSAPQGGEFASERMDSVHPDGRIVLVCPAAKRDGPGCPYLAHHAWMARRAGGRPRRSRWPWSRSRPHPPTRAQVMGAKITGGSTSAATRGSR